jgi:hypothetical protein
MSDTHNNEKKRDAGVTSDDRPGATKRAKHVAPDAESTDPLIVLGSGENDELVLLTLFDAQHTDASSTFEVREEDCRGDDPAAVWNALLSGTLSGKVETPALKNMITALWEQNPRAEVKMHEMRTYANFYCIHHVMMICDT